MEVTYFSEDIPRILLFTEDTRPISPIQPLIEKEDPQSNLSEMLLSEEDPQSDLNNLLPPGLAFVSSSYSKEDNKHHVVHFGSGVLNCHANEGGFLSCTVDFSKDLVERKRMKEPTEKPVDTEISTDEINFTDSSCHRKKEPEEKKMFMDVEEIVHSSDSGEIYKVFVYRNETKPVESSEKENNSVKSKKKTSEKFNSSESGRNSGSGEPGPLVHPIIVVLEEIKKMTCNNEQYKLNVRALMNVFIDPTSSPTTKTVLFHSLKHLILSKTNPLISFSVKKDYSVFCPMYEKTLIEAFIKVDDIKEIHLENLFELAMKNFNELILNKKNISKTGYAAICRIYSNFCKVKKNMKPLKMCSDLLKRSHPFAIFLIYNIVGAWKELFIPKFQPKEYGVSLHSVIAYGVQKNLEKFTTNQGKMYNNLFPILIVAPAIRNPVEAVKMALKNLEKLLNERPTENEFLYIEPIVLLSTIEGAEWAWENVVKNFVLPYLLKFSQKIENERAFSILLEVYVEIGLYVPGDKVGAMSALFKFFKMENAFHYVKPTSAVFLGKLAIFKRVTLFSEVKDWISENENNLGSLEAFLKRQLLSDEPFTENDIIV